MTDRTTRSLDQLAAIDAWCDSFESDWQAGGADLAHAISRITEQQLAAVQVTRREVLEELIKIDLEYRWRRATVPPNTDQRHEDDTVGSPGKTRWELPKIEFYWGQFPELRSDEKIPEELICEEYRVRRQWGDRPPREEFFKRFSSQREQLTPLLDQIDLQLRRSCYRPVSQAASLPKLPQPFSHQRRRCIEPGDVFAMRTRDTASCLGVQSKNGGEDSWALQVARKTR